MEKDKLTYQTARRLRGEKLRDIFADQLIMGEGYGKGLKNAVSLKLRAKLTGIKEKFDPLNIIKFMTFGSRLGPAILGKMMGRSRRDIEYFTGRARPVTSRDSHIPGMEQQGGTGGLGVGVTSVLNDILTFLKKSHEDDMVLREKENNLREGAKLEDDKRHQKLLKALTGRKTATATPVKGETGGNGLFDMIKGMIQGLIDKAMSAFDWILDLKQHVPTILRVFGQFGLNMLRFFASPLFLSVLLPALAVAGAGALFAMWWKDYKEEKSTSNVSDAGKEAGTVEGGKLTSAGETAAAAAAELERLRKSGDEISDPTIRDAMEVQQGIRDDAINRIEYFREDFLKHSGFKKKKRWFTGKTYYEDNSGKEPSEELMVAANQAADEQYKGIWTGEVPDPLGKFKPMPKPAPVKEKATEKPNTNATAPKPVDKPVTAKTTEPVAPPPLVVSPPASAAVAAKTDENVKLNIDSMKVAKKETNETTTNNVVNHMQEQVKLNYIPSVRNMEESFQQMIWGSTRVV